MEFDTTMHSEGPAIVKLTPLSTGERFARVSMSHYQFNLSANDDINFDNDILIEKHVLFININRFSNLG